MEGSRPTVASLCRPMGADGGRPVNGSESACWGAERGESVQGEGTGRARTRTVGERRLGMRPSSRSSAGILSLTGGSGAHRPGNPASLRPVVSSLRGHGGVVRDFSRAKCRALVPGACTAARCAPLRCPGAGSPSRTQVAACGWGSAATRRRPPAALAARGVGSPGRTVVEQPGRARQDTRQVVRPGPVQDAALEPRL